MTKDEALKLALEALTGNWTNETECEALHAKHMESITAIKEALAQPEQEPVAWGMMNDDGKIYDCICPEEHDRVEGEYTVPLYTTPPQRTWVGLTDEDKSELDAKYGDDTLAHLDAIEAKLKEKNGGGV